MTVADIPAVHRALRRAYAAVRAPAIDPRRHERNNLKAGVRGHAADECIANRVLHVLAGVS